MANNMNNIKKQEQTIRNRVQCEEKAFHIVHNLIDSKVDASYLIKCAQWISREHYNDVTEERAITFYVIPKKQYHISTRTNKVYDISERKNFCSNKCLKCSKHYSNQISESPLWMRGKESTVEIKLLPHTEIRGIVGTEVVGISPQRILEDEVKQLKELDLRSAPSGRKSDKTKMKSSSIVNKTANAVTEEENNFNSLQISVENKNGLNVEKDKESDASVDEKTLELRQVVEEKITSEHRLSDAYTENKSKGSTLLHKEDSQIAKQELSCININNNVATTVKQNKHNGTNSVIEIDKSSLQKNIPTVSELDQSQEEERKMNHLMKLLSNRKAVLSGMVDVVTTVPIYSSGTVEIPQAVSEKPEMVSVNNTVIQPFPNQNLSETSQVYPIQSSSETLVDKMSSKDKKMSSRKPKFVSKSPLENIASIIKTWITEETLRYLNSASWSDNNDGVLSFSDPRIKRGYAELCQRLDKQQIDFENLVDDIDHKDHSLGDTGGASKSLPDYSALKKEADEFQLKVTEFITGRAPEPVIEKKEDEKIKDSVYIPTVDIYDQQQIRIKIVLDRLDKFIPDLLVALHLSIQDISSFVRELVYTFKLEKDNIVLKPSGWTLAAIFILKMLGKKNRKFSEAFAEESAKRHFTVLLKGIGHTLADLDVVMEDILSS